MLENIKNIIKMNDHKINKSKNIIFNVLIKNYNFNNILELFPRLISLREHKKLKLNILLFQSDKDLEYRLFLICMYLKKNNYNYDILNGINLSNESKFIIKSAVWFYDKSDSKYYKESLLHPKIKKILNMYDDELFQNKKICS